MNTSEPRLHHVLGMIVPVLVLCMMLFTADFARADCTKWHPHHCVGQGIEAAVQAWDFNITIRNDTGRSIHYRMGGRPNLVNSGYSETWSTKTNLDIAFDNGQNQTIENSLSAGTYYFVYQNNVLMLFRQG